MITPTEYEEYYDQVRDKVSDYTDDELLAELDRFDMGETRPMSVDDRAKFDAICEELDERRLLQ